MNFASSEIHHKFRSLCTYKLRPGLKSTVNTHQDLHCFQHMLKLNRWIHNSSTFPYATLDCVCELLAAPSKPSYPSILATWIWRKVLHVIVAMHFCIVRKVIMQQWKNFISKSLQQGKSENNSKEQLNKTWSISLPCPSSSNMDYGINLTVLASSVQIANILSPLSSTNV